MLWDALEDEDVLTPCMLAGIRHVFEPIFFEYPKGTKVKSVWVPRNTKKYIHQWGELAAMRRWLPNAAATEDGKELSKLNWTNSLGGTEPT